MGLFLGPSSYKVLTRKIILALAIIINLSLLFYFKYFEFAKKSLAVIFSTLKISPFPIGGAEFFPLPLGISFYTFQSISYLVDTYRNPRLSQRSPLSLGLYISLFPQLIAGPIVRYHEINEQINKREHSLQLFISGAERFIIGLSKKLLIANVLALPADRIFALTPALVPFHYLILGAICFSFQIYYDFSGYSDMAIGLGRMFGFRILENFNYPYMSRSMTDFWRRWHISLSSWFKDYLYIPLGGNRKGKIRTSINLFIVFITTGLWHGANFNFIFWGLGHGVLLFAEKTIWKHIGALIKNSFVKNFLGRVYTLLSVAILWVFFKVRLLDGFSFLREIFVFNTGSENTALFIKSMINLEFMLGLSAAVVFCFPWWKNLNLFKANRLAAFRYAALIALLVLSICALASNSYNPFIYFRF
jgi:alginate O-acetyltransferase complex protein AlgI